MNFPGLSPLRLAGAACCLLIPCWNPSSAGFVDQVIEDFANSEIEFQRSDSNVPFFPLGFVDINLYQDTEVNRPDLDPLSFDLASISQGAALPILLDADEALFIGEYVSLSRFDARESNAEDFDVVSLGLPLGWLRQVNRDWQAAAFIMPLAHRANLDNSDWSGEVLGGAFARQVQTDRLWWVYGFYFDVGEGEDLYLPYLGASWQLDDQLTISAILPWPAVLYSPDRDSLYRFGAAPSGASWALNAAEDQVNYTLGNWNLGASAEYRLGGNFWLGVEAGVAGMRSLRLEGGQWEGAEFDIDNTGYVRIALNYRPEVP